MKKKKRGGKRIGAGRKKTKEDTKVIRVPVSKVEEIKKITADRNQFCNSCGWIGTKYELLVTTTNYNCPNCKKEVTYQLI